ncbi:MAG: glycosyltransferase family 1 protein [Propionibacteriaceae bacterium]|nr:glycosyltransferase family 1 protein [Propionibacteriaceae bacterium]
MKVTLVSYGSLGDAIPLVALALGLRDAGHRPVIVAERGAGVLAAEHGLEFHALAGDIAELMRPGAPIAQAVEAGHMTLGSFVNYRLVDRGWLGTIGEAASGSDVVVGMPVAGYHALAVAADVGARPVIAELQPLAPTREFAPSGLGDVRVPRALNRALGRIVDFAGWATIAPSVNRARRELGQPRIANPTRGVRRLGAWSPTLVPTPDDWPSTVSVTGAWRLPTPAGWLPDPALQAFLDAGEPPVFVGFGSMPTFSGTEALMDALLTGLAGHRVILARGSTGHEPASDDVFVTGFAPHDWLFPHCAAIVHHCGAGTTHAALASGTPSIPVPFTLDQPFWAHRLESLEVASPPLDPRRPHPDAVRTAHAHVRTTRVRERAAALAHQVATEDGVRTAVAAIEDLPG